MSVTVNPYESPEAGIVPERVFASSGALTETMLVYLKGASPWLRFVSILGFISAGVSILSGIFFLAFIPLVYSSWSAMTDVRALSLSFSLFFNGAIAAYCIGGGVLLFFLSLFAYRFGVKIRSYLKTGAELHLESAFKNNMNLWKYLGILCIISLAFIPLIIIGSIAVVAHAAMFI